MAAELYSNEAERALVASLMVDASAWVNVCDVVRADDFYITRWRWVWEALTVLGEAADYVSVCDQLRRAGKLDEGGRGSEIVNLLGELPSAMNARQYANTVADYAGRRRLLAAASAIAKELYALDKPLNVVMEAAEKAVVSANSSAAGGGLAHVKPLMNEMMSRLLAGVGGEQHRPSGISTGWKGLDEIIGGLMGGDMLVIGARPGMGKTEMMLQMMLQQMGQRIGNVAIFSLEMSAEALGQRLTSSLSGVALQALRTNRLNEGDTNRAVDAMGRIGGLQLWIDDTPRISPATLRMRMRRAHARQAFACIYVDYLQLMDGSGGAGRRGDRVAEVDYIAAELKATARELGVPLVVAAQVSRGLEGRSDKRPLLADLRESGGIENAADQVVFLYRQDVYYNPNDPQYDLSMKDATEVLVRKNRNGDTGEFHLKWDAQARRLIEPVQRKI